MAETLIFDLLVILAAGLFAGLVCRWLHVSVLIGYLSVGAILGQGCLGWVQGQQHELESFAEAGVFLLLFSIGLEFSLDDLRRLGSNLVIGGATQMALVAVPVTLVLRMADFSWQSASLIAAATSFSSTVLVFKALSEWGQSSTPHGRRSIGILLFQDAALVPLLLLVPILTGTGEVVGAMQYGSLALKSALFVAGVVGARRLLDRWIIPAMAHYRSPELVILFTLVSLGCVTMVAYKIGLPPAVGALAAGLIFSGNRWSKQIDALVLPFRETFAAVFFVGLGLISNPGLLITEPLVIVQCLLAVVAIKAFAATVALRLTRLPWKASVGMGIGLAHVGEFAFVLVLLGLESGLVSQSDYERLVAVAVGSLILTPMLLKFGLRWTRSDSAVDDLEAPTLSSGAARGNTARGDTKGGDPGNAQGKAQGKTGEKRLGAGWMEPGSMATVIGAGPIGRRVASQLETVGHDVCLVDLSPINLHSFAQEGFRTIAGDASKTEILRLAEADRAPVAAVCVPNDDTAIQVVRAVRRVNPACWIVVRCRYQANAGKLKKAGAAAVVSEEVEATAALLKVLTQFQTDGDAP